MAENGQKIMIYNFKTHSNNFLARKLVVALCVVVQALVGQAFASDVENHCVVQKCNESSPARTSHVIQKQPANNKYIGPNKAAVVPKDKYDALAIEPAILFKETPPKEIDLPGVLRVDGISAQAFDPSRSHRISWGNQGIQPIILSLRGPDLIVTPFNDPYIVGNTYVTIKKRATSNNVYVSFSFPDGVKPAPVSIFIEDPAGGPAMGLQLIPKQIPQQIYEVVAEIEHDKQLTKGADYTTHVQELMEMAAFGSTPTGYSVSVFNLPPIVMHGLRVDPIRRLSNTEGDLFVYQVTNPTEKTVMLDEREFDGPRVRAVSIVPKPELRGKEKATVIVFARKAGGK
jgi:conjugal transfer pilus assembly protein TraK